MSIPIKLSDIIDGIERETYESSSYLQKKTGHVVAITDETLREAETNTPLESYPEWECQMIQTARDIIADESREHYVPLPPKFEIDEYSIMERFCLSIQDKYTFRSLERAIKGKGAFQRFKACIHRLGIVDAWYRYRADAIRTIAREWCEENDIDYTDD